MLFILTILISLVIVVAPVWLGTKLGSRQRKKEPGIEHPAVGSVVGAALGLLAFMLAFTFQITTDRFGTRKELLMNEVSAIRTAYYQAQLLEDTFRIPSRRLIREYVDLRVMYATGTSEIEDVVMRSRQIQDSIWHLAILLAKDNRSSEVNALYISNVTEMMELFRKRIIVGLYTRIPVAIMWVLYFVAFFSMVILGYQFGIVGRGNKFIIGTLAIIFAAVMWLVYVLDDPVSRVLKLSQRQVFELQEEIHRSQ